MRKRYLYHCRECTVIISYDIEANQWTMTRDAFQVEETDDGSRRLAFDALDRWMTGRESVYGHSIFVHPGRGLRSPN